MTISDRERTAYHEAGHAVAHVALGTPFRYVTIRPRDPEVAGLVKGRRGSSDCPSDDSAQYQPAPEDMDWVIARSHTSTYLCPPRAPAKAAVTPGT